MYIVHMLGTNPFAAVALCLCLATIWSCARIVRRRLGHDRFLLAVLGFLSTCEATRIFVEHSATLPRAFGYIADFVIASLFLVAVIVVKTSSAEHEQTKMQLRLAEGQSSQGTRSRGRQLKDVSESALLNSPNQTEA